MVQTLFGSIPSPSFNTLSLGPFEFRMYGLCIALGVIAAIWISSKRWEARGGDPSDIGAIALWAVPAGVIGARMYHVATDWKTYDGHWVDAVKIWNGGLGIPGGIALGVIVGAIVAKRRGLDVVALMDVVAPALPVAQAIGRLGNWFNQELFGRPTSLPWGLEVSPDKVFAAGYAPGTLFHPTFLYEALWNLALAGFLVLIERKKKLYPGELFTLYVLGYAIGRLWVESLRIDQASLIFGVRINIWMAIIVALVTLIVFSTRRYRTPSPRGDADRRLRLAGRRRRHRRDRRRHGRGPTTSEEVATPDASETASRPPASRPPARCRRRRPPIRSSTSGAPATRHPEHAPTRCGGDPSRAATSGDQAACSAEPSRYGMGPEHRLTGFSPPGTGVARRQPTEEVARWPPTDLTCTRIPWWTPRASRRTPTSTTRPVARDSSSSSWTRASPRRGRTSARSWTEPSEPLVAERSSLVLVAESGAYRRTSQVTRFGEGSGPGGVGGAGSGSGSGDGTGGGAGGSGSGWTGGAGCGPGGGNGGSG